MNYRFLEITSFYPKYLEYFYKKNTQLESFSYEEHYKLLMDDFFAECDFIHPELQKLGNETKLVIYNDINLQRKWKLENKNKSLFEIVCDQIMSFQPNVLYISDMGLFTKDELIQIKRIIGKNCKLIGWHFSTVSVYKSILCLFDQIYTGSKYILNQIREFCPNSELLYHAFETSIYDRISLQKRQNKIVFPGSILIGEEIHNNRIDMFGSLFNSGIPCSFYGDIYGSFLPKTPKQVIKWLLMPEKPSKSRIMTEKRLRQIIKPGVFGKDYYEILSNYSICVNQHAKIAGTGSGNMRMFEATGMGCCLITDFREENSDLFIEDEEIVVYRNYDELVEKSKYLINNPNEANKIALAGQRKTTKEYSYINKARKMDVYIQKLLTEK